MRVCVITEFFYPDQTGGTGPVVSDLARRLQDSHGIQVDVITSRHTYRESATELPACEDWDGITIHRVKAPNFNAKGTAQRSLGNLLFVGAVTRKLLSSKRYDAVLITTAPPFLPIAADLNRLVKRTPFVYVVYDLEPDRIVGLKLMKATSVFVKGMKWLQRRWLKRATTVAAIGRCMAQRIEESYKIPAQLTSVVPVGSVDLANSESADSVFRKEHDLKEFVVMYSGNFGRYHDFDTILDAAKRLQSEDPGVTFVLVGRGAQKERVQRRVQAERLQNVRLMDFVATKDYPDMLAASDVCLVTMESGLEGTCVPSKFYSILAAGRPVLALVSKDSEVAMALDEHRCGIRVVPRNVDDFVRGILTLRHDEAARAEMGSRARDAFEKGFTADHTASRFHFILSAAAGRPAADDRSRQEPKLVTLS